MIPVIVIPYMIGFVSEIFLITSLLLTFYYNYICYELYKYKKNQFELSRAKKVFGYSILYLFLIFVIFLLDGLI